MKEYGVVVIGCGHIGRQHLEDIYCRPGIRVEGVVDSDPARAEECFRRYGALSWGTDYRPYLERDEVQIVLICTYTDTHLTILKDALAAGKHIICEKPIGRTQEEGHAFFQAVQQSRSKVLVSHLLRHNATYQKAAALIQAGEIGDLRVMRMVQNHHSKDWERYRRLLEDCTPVLDCGVHYFDVMQWFSGKKIIRVDGFGTRIDPDLPEGTVNYGVANVLLEDGVIGYYESGWSKTLPSCNVKEFVGSQGSLQIILNQFRSSDTEEGDLIRLYHSDSGEYRTVNLPAHYRNLWGQLRCLIAMIEEDAPAWPAMEDVYSAFCAALEAQEKILALHHSNTNK